MTTDTAYPSADDYVKAVQNPQAIFTTTELKSAYFPTHPLLGVPMPASGSCAVVFKAEVGGTEHALRFFTRQTESDQRHYRALNQHFQDKAIAGHMATSTWIDDAITVNRQTWPTVRMQWVNGRTLDQYVDGLVADHDTNGLRALATAWRDMVGQLQRAEFAHGDLQHGNVLVDTDGRLRLVDFDGSWIAPLAGDTPPNETGHRNYQRADSTWGRWMDTFPALVVYTSLLALTKNPRLWDASHTGENLILTSDDLQPPHRTSVWEHLTGIEDQHLTSATARLKQCCAPAWTPAGSMEALIQPRWWEQTSSSAATRGSAAERARAEETKVIHPQAGNALPSGLAPSQPIPSPRRRSYWTQPAASTAPLPPPRPMPQSRTTPVRATVPQPSCPPAAEWLENQTSSPLPPTGRRRGTRVAWIAAFVLVLVAALIALFVGIARPGGPPKPAAIATIPVGQGPLGVVFTPDGRRAYVSNYTAGTVSVIDTPSYTVTATISVSRGPAGLSISPDGQRAYVANTYSDSVSVINTSNNTITATVGVGRLPWDVAVAPDGRRAYVVDRYDDPGPDNVAVIETARNTVSYIQVENEPIDVAITPDGRFAYVANMGSNTLSVIDTSSATVMRSIGVGQRPADVQLTADGKRAYVANAGSNTISVIDTASNTITKTITSEQEPSGTSIAPHDHIYVTNNTNILPVIDTTNNSVVARVEGGKEVGWVAINPAGDRAYVTNSQSNTVTVIDTDED